MATWACQWILALRYCMHCAELRICIPGISSLMRLDWWHLRGAPETGARHATTMWHDYGRHRLMSDVGTHKHRPHIAVWCCQLITKLHSSDVTSSRLTTYHNISTQHAHTTHTPGLITHTQHTLAVLFTHWQAIRAVGILPRWTDQLAATHATTNTMHAMRINPPPLSCCITPGQPLSELHGSSSPAALPQEPAAGTHQRAQAAGSIGARVIVVISTAPPQLSTAFTITGTV
jgi:hypothetical protein